MQSSGAVARRALGGASRLITTVAMAGRWPLALAVVASLVISALGPPTPVRADPSPYPDARLQLIIRKIHLRDDVNWRPGELELFAVLCEDPSGGPYVREWICGTSGGAIEIRDSFSGNAGDDLVLNRVVPSSADFAFGNATLEAGLPVYRGVKYLLHVDLFSRDQNNRGSLLGDLFIHVDEAHTWGLGTYTVRSIFDNGSPGHYELTFEIRQTPLPDLSIKTIREIKSADGQFFCAVIQNVGDQPAPQAGLQVRVDGALLRGITLPALDVSRTTEHCVIRTELPARQHQLRFVLDEADQIPEMNELDNAYEWKIQAVPAPIGSPAPTATPVPTGTPAPIGTPTLTTACAPRPPIKVTQASVGGRLLAHVQVSPLNGQQPNTLRSLRLGALQNARVSVNGQPIASGQGATVPAGSTAIDLSVERVAPGQPVTVPFTVVDSCGEWQTFVGGGTGAGL